ncbi:hypothetical protein C2U72_00075 [Prosthecomicrobium hirschii]|uniref:hypothetical protein n=1 Tax=Prosthecodimorpha hirschii TaxID=665126 RepID=UPI0011269D61|nr:hypothetical protein [Prosthecomicrobium hirschii]TPQ53056.1 hypothetical protein C2U72_00075 [Prosthecomicrobium hirschii]
MSETIYSAAGLPVFVGGVAINWSIGETAGYLRMCNRPPFDGRPEQAFDAGFADPEVPCPYRLPSSRAAEFFAGQTVARRLRAQVEVETGGARP